MKSRIKGKYRDAFANASRAAVQVLQLDIPALENNEPAQREALRDVERANQALENIYEVYEALILEWNWIDFDTGAALPPPDAQTIRSELDQVQMAWLNQQVQRLLKYRATEGNALSGNGSKTG
jgi:hypothetical protein